VGAIGSRERLDYTAIGSSVNLAARLCSIAKGSQVLVSQAVVTELAGAFSVRPMSPVSLKGFAEAIPVYDASLESNVVADVGEYDLEQVNARLD
jgi:adenylate cyclase